MEEAAGQASRERTLTPDEAARRVALARDAVVGEVQKVVVGHEDLIESLLIALFSRGHVLISGRSGSARTSLLSAFARTLNLKFRHLLMSADTLPEDVSGYEKGAAESDSTARRIVRGPVFSELLVADGFDQSLRRTQAELFHALRHGRAVIEGKTYELEEPRFVCATRDTNRSAATNAATEKQLDQFMFSFELGYPSQQEERAMVARRVSAAQKEIRVVLRPRDILWVRQLAEQMPVLEQTVAYAVDLVRATRPEGEGVPQFVKSWIDFGAGPRASQQLVAAAKARALVKGRSLVHSADIRAVARPVLRHRIFLSRDAEQRGITVEQVVDKIVAVVKERWAGTQRPADLVVVSDPAPQAIPGNLMSSSQAQPVQNVLPNQPFLIPQPPPTSAWPAPASSEFESNDRDAGTEQSCWPPGESPSERGAAGKQNS